MSDLAIGVDVGGTFTDVVLVDRASGENWIVKVPTATKDPAEGFGAGIEQILKDAGREIESTSYLLHGTTIATNAILEGRGARTCLVTTRGFRYVLEIGRHDVPRDENMFGWQKPQRPVAPELIWELTERLGPSGDVIVELDEDDLARIVGDIAREGIESVAVCLLNSFASPLHERRVESALTNSRPALPVSLSSQVLPAFREYERTTATVLNAYVQPIVRSYMERLQTKLGDVGFRGRLWIMSSNGGVMSAESAARQSIQLALSGPAAGVIGAQLVGEQAGFGDLISIDIGGTSTDVCLVQNGQAEISTEGRIGHWPLQIPMVDIHTIGAGGGSIARVSEDGGIVVGPESAGAVPGPACYGAGGTEPTVTDANLVLGRVTATLLAGRMMLDADAARASLAPIAESLSISIEEAAQGVIDIANNNLVGAIRLVSVERGHDPADFSLVAFGGAGPLHAADLVNLLGMRTAIIPPQPGVLSAIGMLASDVRTDFTRTSLHRPPDYDAARLEAVCQELQDDAAGWLATEGVPIGDRRLQFSADLRYENQGSELTVRWDWSNDEPLSTLVDRFHDRHEQLFSFAMRNVDVEIVSVRVSATGVMPRVARAKSSTHADSSNGIGAPAPVGSHRLYSPESRTYDDCPLYSRADIHPGNTIDGPAVIEQFDTTTLLLRGQVAVADAAGNLLITQSTAERPGRAHGGGIT